MTTNTAAYDAETTKGIGIFPIVVRAAEAIVRANAKRRAERAFAGLDQHLLQDVGLNPGEVRRLHLSAIDMIAKAPAGSAHLVLVGQHGVFSIPLRSH